MISNKQQNARFLIAYTSANALSQIESPFRLMDEYDVFLDEVSRKVTLDELQKYALRPQQRGRQLLIITPNNLNDVITSNDVRIKRMAPPSRNHAHGLQQQVLDFPAAN
jgi:hypothetical protein